MKHLLIILIVLLSGCNVYYVTVQPVKEVNKWEGRNTHPIYLEQNVPGWRNLMPQDIIIKSDCEDCVYILNNKNDSKL